MTRLEEFDDGVVGLLLEMTSAKRLLPFGFCIVLPLLPVQDVQPEHFVVNCQWVPLTLLPAVSFCNVAPVYAAGCE